MTTDVETERLIESLEDFRRFERERLTLVLERRNDIERRLISIVLLFHLEVELLLGRAIAAELPKGSKLIKRGGLTFAKKLAVFESLGLARQPMINSVKRLNKLRNECAHNPEKYVSQADIEKIGEPLGTVFNGIRKKYAGRPTELTFYTCRAIHELLVGVLFFAEHPEARKARGKIDAGRREA